MTIAPQDSEAFATRLFCRAADEASRKDLLAMNRDVIVLPQMRSPSSAPPFSCLGQAPPGL